MIRTKFSPRRLGIWKFVFFLPLTLILSNPFFGMGQMHVDLARAEGVVAALPEGSLIRLRGQPYTYVIQGGRKCYIPDAETFQSRGYQWSQVIEVDRATLDSIVTGLPIPSVRAPFQYTPPAKTPGAPSAGVPVTASPPPSPLTPSAPGPPVYPGPSAPSTSSPTSTYPSISAPTSSYSSSYPSSSSSVFPNGTLVKGSGPQIYLIQNGLRCLIPDLKTLNNLGLNQNNVVTIDDSALRSIPLGNPVSKR